MSGPGRILALSVLAALALGCTRRRDVELVILRDGVSVDGRRVELRLSGEPCSALLDGARAGVLPDGEVTVLRSGSSSAPVRVEGAGDGRITVLVTAFDPDTCAISALGCREATLSSGEPVEVSLGAFDGENPCSPPSVCSDGACVEPGVDAGPRSDAGTPAPPCEPETSCELPAGGDGLCCDGACVDPATEAAHCGGCGNLCVGGCVGGTCPSFLPTRVALTEADGGEAGGRAAAYWFALDANVTEVAELAGVSVEGSGRLEVTLDRAPPDPLRICERPDGCAGEVCACPPDGLSVAFGVIGVFAADAAPPASARFEALGATSWAQAVVVYASQGASAERWAALSSRYPRLGLDELLAAGLDPSASGITVYDVIGARWEPTELCIYPPACTVECPPPPPIAPR